MREQDLDELIEKIEKCRCCGEGIVHPEPKYYLKYGVYKKWIPQEIKCIFIGESPPSPNGVFFYKDDEECSFRTNLFSILGICRSDKEGLEEFKKKGFFLIDAIECGICKKPIPKCVFENCLKIFDLKMKLLSTSTSPRKLVVLGKSASKILQMWGVEELKGCSVTRDAGEIRKNLFLGPLPVNRNKKYWDNSLRRDLRLFLET